MGSDDRSIFMKSRTSARNDTTRRKLIDAALAEFASLGYAAATTRSIAEKAGANLAAIPYHFGGKEGLYHAVVQFVADTIGEQALTELQTVERLLERSRVHREELLAGLELILTKFGRIIIGSDIAGRLGPIILREQMQPTSAFDRLYEGGLGRGHRILCKLTARLMDRPEDDPEASIRAHTLLGQVLAFRAAREIIMQRLGWKTFNEQRVEETLKVIVENCRRIFMQTETVKGKAR